MPADYTSTAQALALSISPISSPSPELQSTQRPLLWTRSSRSTSHRQLGNPYRRSSSQGGSSYNDLLLKSARTLSRRISSTYTKMSLLQRILAAVFLTISSVFGILFLIYNEKIFAWVAPAAAKWRDVRFGWLILFALNFCTAFPPIIGYSSTVTIAGFVYGFPRGWFIVAAATVAGSLCSFLTSRTIFSGYVNRLVGEDKRFTALALTLKHDGLKILVMIRFCPLPYSLSNAAMSTFPGIHPLMFALATALSTPKLLIHLFIGSRMAALAKGEGTKDFGTRIINFTSIALGLVVGAAAGCIIYRRTMARAKQLEREEQERLRAAGMPVAGSRGYTDGGALPDGDDDDISLWDNAIEGEPLADAEAYRDDFTDDEGNPFDAGDLDEEAAAIGNKSVRLT